MGYNTDFMGQINIEPALSPEEIAFLNNFNRTRRMDREKGPYYVDGTGSFGQGNDSDILDHNQPPEGQPGLWCQWVPTEDGNAIEWDTGEKFYHAAEWMKYIIDYFIKPEAAAKAELPFLLGHNCNGEIEASGDEHDDNWLIIVKNNVVTVQDLALTPTGEASAV